MDQCTLMERAVRKILGAAMGQLFATESTFSYHLSSLASRLRCEHSLIFF